ncbi:MAG: type II toxin-antitoxin system VapC family toxin [Pseudomonadota bacterium]
MKLLLDTHAFIWWDSEPARLSPLALALCRDSENTLLLSVASTWEMQIKIQLGKLKLGLPLAELIENQQRVNSLGILRIGLEHVLALDQMPSLHKDPFDRLLVAQARVEGANLVTSDPIMANYPVNVIW